MIWGLSEHDARLWVRSQRFALAVPEEGDVYDLLKFLALVEPVVLLKAGEPAESPADAESVQVVFSCTASDLVAGSTSAG